MSRWEDVPRRMRAAMARGRLPGGLRGAPGPEGPEGPEGPTGPEGAPGADATIDGARLSGALADKGITNLQQLAEFLDQKLAEE